MARVLVAARRGPLPFRGYPLRELPPRGRPSCEPRRDPGKFQARASRPAAPPRSIRQQTTARSDRRGSGKKGGTHSMWIGEGRAPYYSQLWDLLLTGPRERLPEVLEADSDESRALRQATPCAGVIEPPER